MVIMDTHLNSIAIRHTHLLCSARWLFWQRRAPRYVSEVTRLETVTSILLMIVIEIVIQMYLWMMSRRLSGLTVAIATQRALAEMTQPKLREKEINGPHRRHEGQQLKTVKFHKQAQMIEQRGADQGLQ